MRPLWIVKAGSTVSRLVPRRGDFEDWFRAGLGRDAATAPRVRPYRGDALPPPAEAAAVVVTGSNAMVTDEEPWSLRTQAWLREVVDRGVPVLGVCYGHQLLARALGGEVGWNPRGREIGTVAVELTEPGRRDPLLAGLPTRLIVQESHSQSVLRLPDGARLLASNAHDPHQAFAAGDRAWGLQFHPEFDADVVRGYLEERRTEIVREGRDVEELLAGARDSEHGARVLRSFAALVTSFEGERASVNAD